MRSPTKESEWEARRSEDRKVQVFPEGPVGSRAWADEGPL